MDGPFSLLEPEVRDTQVVVFAGGMGKRMGVAKPKALVELGGRALIDRCVELYSNAGFSSFIFLLGYGHEMIARHIGDGSSYGIKPTFVVDPVIGCGRGRALKYALWKGAVDSTMRSLITFPDDVFTDAQLPLRVLADHLDGARRGILASLVLTRGMNWPYGAATVDASGLIREFVEKPYIFQPTSVGHYVFEPEVHKLITESAEFNLGKAVDLEQTVIPQLARLGKLQGVYIPSECWLPVNTQKDLEDAEFALLRTRPVPRGHVVDEMELEGSVGVASLPQQ